jgi:uncharacterized protein (DUF305 family)
MTHSHYSKLAINLILSFIAMYLVMFAMIDGFDDFYNNVNMAYMALMMVAPMAILMLWLMGSMYENRRLNLFLYVLFAALFAFGFWGTRTQTPVGNEQFIRSMIPHHSGAILMCREAQLTDPELVELCGRIRTSQREEIDQMKRVFERY